MLPNGIRLASFEVNESINIDALSNEASHEVRVHENSPGVPEGSTLSGNMINKVLPSEKHEALVSVLSKNALLFDFTQKATIIRVPNMRAHYGIDVGTMHPLRHHAYRIYASKRMVIFEQDEDMLARGDIHDSASPWLCR